MRDNRQIVVQGIFIVVGFVFLVKLFFIQVIDGSYKSAAESNVIQKVIQYPHRGQVYDRNGKLVVMNGPVYDIMMIAKKAKIEDTLAFCSVMGFTQPQFDSLMVTIRASRSFSSVKPYPLLKQISNRDFARIQDRLIDFPGFYAVARTIRSYPHASMSNALGYIGEVNKTFIEKQEEPYYKQGDYMGLSGLESFYEKYLRGQRGVKYVLVNVRGVEKGSFKDGAYDTTAVAGESLVSSINLDVQQYAESLMVNKVGSIVAIEPSTGEILAMVSTPSYDPNLLTGRDFPVNFMPLQRDPLIPLYNRPIQAVYRPGSIFKLVHALVALQEGAITPGTAYPCGNAPVKCHPHSGHNDLFSAIRYSCNPYFYQVFRKEILLKETGHPYKDAEQGLLRWHEHVASFGFGQKLGIDLPNEKRGLLPDTAIFNRKYGKGRWKFSNIYSVGIGEGELGVVPIQMANLAAIIANRGYYYTPHIIKSIGKDGKPLPEYAIKHQTSIDSKHFKTIVDGMEEVVKAGTARLASLERDSIIVCGKTGTSQNAIGKDHSVFVCFAPRDNPKIAVAVYVENAGFGGQVAAPIASLVIEKYLKGQITRKERQALEKTMMEKNFMPEAPAKKQILAKKEESVKKEEPVKKEGASKKEESVKVANTPIPPLPALQVRREQEQQ